jgi:hypothetical protein
MQLYYTGQGVQVEASLGYDSDRARNLLLRCRLEADPSPTDLAAE